VEAGLPAFQLDSGPPKIPVSRYLGNELRFRVIEQSDPERFKLLQSAAQADTDRRWKLHQDLAAPVTS